MHNEKCTINLSPMLAGYVVLLALVQVGVISLGLAKIPLNAFLAWLIVLIAGLGGLAMGWRMAHVQAVEDARGDEPCADHIHPWTWVMISFGVLILGWIFWLAYHVPDLSFDGIMYHTPPIHFWALKGYLHWIHADRIDSGMRLEPLINGFPKGVETLAFLLFKLTGRSEMVHTVNVFFLLLGMLAISHLALRLGASPIMALAAGTAWMLIPVNLNQAFTTLNDGSYGATVAAFLALFWEFMRVHRLSAENGVQNVGRPYSFIAWLLPAVTCGAAMGLMLGIKGTGVPMTVIGLGLIVLSIFRDTRQARESLWRGFLFLIVVVLFAALVAGYWYLRNWIHTGNPLYPLELKLGHRVIFPGWTIAQMMGMESNTPPELRRLPNGLRFLFTWCQIGRPGLRWPHAISAPEARLGGLGWIWLLGGLLAIPVMLVYTYKKRRMHARSLIQILLFVCLAFIIQPMNWWARYTVWLHALGLPCFAALATIMFAGNLDTNSIRTRLSGRTWVVVCFLILLIEAPLSIRDWFPKRLVRHPHQRYSKKCLAQPWRLRFKQGWSMPSDLKGTLVESVFADHQPVAFTPMHFHPGKPEYCQMFGFVCLPIGARQIYANIDPSNLEQLQNLRSLNVRYLFGDDDFPLTEAALKTLNIRRSYHAPGMYLLELQRPDEIRMNNPNASF